MEPYLGQILMFAGNFAPVGWALCNGQLMSISQNTALFSLLGTTYGGDGVSTFGLPDLRGRVPIHAGQGPGLQPYTWGEKGGTESVTLLGTQMPAHTHGFTVPCSNQGPDIDSPENAVPANLTPAQTYSTTANAVMKEGSCGVAGASQPHDNMQPYLCVNYIIALQGIFPSRS